MKDISNLPVQYEAENALLAIEEEYSIVPDCTTKKGYALTKVRIRDLVTLRTGLEARRKEKKAGALAYGKRLDTCAKELKARIEKLENKHKDEKAKVDAEKARIKQVEKERKETILKRIDAITKFSDTNGLSSDEIAAKIEKLRTASVGEDKYQEFRKEAREAKAESLSKLKEAHEGSVEQERIAEKERVERERIAEEQRQTQIKLDAEREKQEAIQAKLDQERAEFEAEVQRQALVEDKRQARIKKEQDERAAEARAEIDGQRKKLEAELATKRKEDKAKLDAERAELKAEKSRLARNEQVRLDKAVAEQEEAERVAEEEAERVAEEEANAERRNERRVQARADMFDVANEFPADDEDEVRTICNAIVDAVIDGKISFVRFLG